MYIQENFNIQRILQDLSRTTNALNLCLYYFLLYTVMAIAYIALHPKGQLLFSLKCLVNIHNLFVKCTSKMKNCVVYKESILQIYFSFQVAKSLHSLSSDLINLWIIASMWAKFQFMVKITLIQIYFLLWPLEY